MVTKDRAAIAVDLAVQGCHIFPVDHPDRPVCVGLHGPSSPCDGTRGKHPAVKWKSEATTDDDQIVAWFAGNSRNIGIACGPSGLLVIDEDTVGDFERYAKSVGQELPTTFTVSTGKGYHYYFRAPSVRLGNAEGQLRSYGINVRGDGGYVVGPESVHENGKRYKILDDVIIGDCPEWLIVALSGRSNDATAGVGFANPPQSAWPIDQGIPYGNRHNSLISYAGRLRHMGLSFDEARVLYRHRWEACEQPPNAPHSHPWEYALAGLEDVYRRYPAGGDMAAMADDSADWWTELAAKYVPLDWYRVWSETPDEVEWLVEPLIERGQSVAIFSPPKVGKSLLILEVAAALASGRGVLDNPARPPMRVLYVDLENTNRDIRDRLIDLDYAPDDLVNLIYLSFPDLPALDSERGGRHLLAAAIDNKAELVIIDTLSRVISGKENDADTFHSFYRHAIVPLKGMGISVIRLDHAGKDITQGQRGSSAKETDVDAVWLLAERTRDRFYLKRKISRSPYGRPLVELRRRSNPLRHEVAGEDSLSAEVADLIAELDRLDVPQEAGRSVARKALSGAEIKASNKTLAEAVHVRKTGFELSRTGPADASKLEGR